MAEVQQNIMIDDTAKIVHVASSGMIRRITNMTTQKMIIKPPGVIAVEVSTTRAVEIVANKDNAIHVCITHGSLSVNHVVPAFTRDKIKLLPGRTDFVFAINSNDAESDYITFCLEHPDETNSNYGACTLTNRVTNPAHESSQARQLQSPAKSPKRTRTRKANTKKNPEV